MLKTRFWANSYSYSLYKCSSSGSKSNVWLGFEFESPTIMRPFPCRNEPVLEKIIGKICIISWISHYHSINNTNSLPWSSMLSFDRIKHLFFVNTWSCMRNTNSSLIHNLTNHQIIFLNEKYYWKVPINFTICPIGRLLKAVKLTCMWSPINS